MKKRHIKYNANIKTVYMSDSGLTTLSFKECASLCILEYLYTLSMPKITFQNRKKNFKAKEKVKIFSLILEAGRGHFRLL